jgi:hypothetical protein
MRLMALVKRFGCRGILCVLLGFATFGCGDDEEDADGGGANWTCFDNAAYGECGCYAVPPGEVYEDQTQGAMEVSSCPSYQLCLKYYDVFFEWDACSCGASDMMPLDAMDIQSVSACPPG